MNADYLPGSFSKNFGWKGGGLHRLYDTIAYGFRGELAPVYRSSFREQNRIADKYRWLIPANYFLFNADGAVQPDELVRLTVAEPHSRQWDLVALFALHFSRVGDVPGPGDGRALAWANAYLREHVARDGSWRYEALSSPAIDAFLLQHLNADEATRVKCRSNWRHILELCGLLHGGLFETKLSPQEWVPFALYLAWDRYQLGGHPFDRSLLSLMERDELHKLAGVEEAVFRLIAVEAYSRYREMGGLKRLKGG